MFFTALEYFHVNVAMLRLGMSIEYLSCSEMGCEQGLFCSVFLVRHYLVLYMYVNTSSAEES